MQNAALAVPTHATYQRNCLPTSLPPTPTPPPVAVALPHPRPTLLTCSKNVRLLLICLASSRVPPEEPVLATRSEPAAPRPPRTHNSTHTHMQPHAKTHTLTQRHANRHTRARPTSRAHARTHRSHIPRGAGRTPWRGFGSPSPPHTRSSWRPHDPCCGTLAPPLKGKAHGRIHAGGGGGERGAGTPGPPTRACRP